jgi:hypothetical protein
MDYEKLICDLHDLATVYKLTGQTGTSEYRLATQAADAIAKLQIQANNYKKALDALERAGHENV